MAYLMIHSATPSVVTGRQRCCWALFLKYEWIDYFSANPCSMYKYQNKKANFEGKSYEIFWVTDFAQHIMNRKDHPSHKIDLMEIEAYVQKAPFIKEKNVWQGLFRHNGKYYQAVAFFIEKPKRCVIKTCHVVNSGNLLEICKKLNIQ